MKRIENRIRIVCLIGALMIAPLFANDKNKVEANGVTLTIKPLEKQYFKENRIQVEFSYRVTRPQGDGTAEVTLHNADTGENFTRTVPAEFSLGEHSAWAAWGGKAPWTSAKESEFDLLLGGDEVEDKGVTDGLYIAQVSLKDAQGKVIVEKKHSSDDIGFLRATGGFARKIARETIDRQAADITGWLAELTALEAKARAAGADTSVPGLMLTALRETVRQQPGRVSASEFHVVSDNHKYCARQVPKTRAQLEALIANPASGMPLDIFPRPAERMTFKNGYFHAGDKPVFMFGMCMFALWPDIELMREMNFNLVHIGEEIDALYPDSATEAASGELLVANGKPPYKIKDFLDKCAELGIKVDLGLTARPPKWFFEKYPDARLKGHSVAGFIPWDIEHPDTLKWVEKYFDDIMAIVGNHPALNCIWLANEPTMLNYGPLSEALFREAMQAKYVTVDALNEAWGAAFESFDGITLPLKKDAGEGHTDFWWFNLDRLTNFFEFMQRCVRKHDLTVNTCFKLNNLQMGWYCPSPNVDQEAVSDLGEIIGMDSGTLSFAKPYYDWLRSLSPEKPMANLEFKGGGAGSWLTNWRAAFLGMAGVDLWCWHANPKFSSAMCYTAALHDGPLAMYHIQRNIDVVMAFQQFPRSPFVVVYPDPVLPRVKNYFDVHTPAVHALRRLGYAVDYATEKRIAAGRLDEMKYDIIVLPALNHAKDATLARAGKFVADGGTAIVLGALPERDPMGKKRDLGWLATPDSATTGIIDGCPESVRFAHGKGTVWVLPAADENTYKNWIGHIAAKTLPPLPVVIDDEFESRTIAWKNDKGEPCYVTSIMCYSLRQYLTDDALPVKATFDMNVKDAVDLITGEKIDVTNITIAPHGVRLIQWTPEK